ncbi:MAG: hypothetical protein RL748_894 [Pseudomonadota bacterium]|jgi:alkaline phosphatase D
MQLPAFFVKQHRLNTPAQTSRRRFLRQFGSSTLATSAALGVAACSSLDSNDASPLLVAFAHGVASGDPLRDRIMLWTRVSPQRPDESREVKVIWQIARDPAFQQIANAGSVFAGPDSDYTVKVDATGLQPGQVYYYRFSSGTAHSPVGRSKTLPAGDVAQVKLAVFSCANYPAGYFNVYADAAKQGDIDAALHIGDYIYEYDSKGYACHNAKKLGRLSEPKNTLIVLADYRRRYAQYRSDPDLQKVHAQMPFITVWDDHEIADDTWRDGAAEHKAAHHGPFSMRKKAAIQAYHEWLPIRPPAPEQPEKIYRSFDFGKLLSLHMLDTRVAGRDQQVFMESYEDEKGELDCGKFCDDVRAPRRQMLGRQQLGWLEQNVRQSTALWQVLGQQVLMARMEYPQAVALGEMNCSDFLQLKARAQTNPASLSADQRACLSQPNLPCFLDSWDGYQAERERVFDIFKRQNKNLVVLAGDTHNAWANDLLDAKGKRVGVEFATASVSSPGMEGTNPNGDHANVARIMEQIIEPLYYAQTSKRGYMVLTANAQEVRCDWHFVNTVHQRQFSAACERSLRTRIGQARIEELQGENQRSLT